MLPPTLVLLDRSHRTALLAGNGLKHDGIVRTDPLAAAAVDAGGRVDLGAVALERNGLPWAIDRARTRHTSAASVRDEVVVLHAGTTRLIDDGQHRLGHRLAFQSLASILPQGAWVFRLVLDTDPENGHQTVHGDRAVLVDATPDGVAFARIQRARQIVNVTLQGSREEKLQDLGL